MTERGVEPVSLPELLERADIISMHSPATESAHRHDPRRAFPRR